MIQIVEQAKNRSLLVLLLMAATPGCNIGSCGDGAGSCYADNEGAILVCVDVG